ncbi:MAG: DUF4198 domain-containing protein [Planctomycetota bacterium]
MFRFFFLIVLFLVNTSVYAHEFWLVPSSFRPDLLAILAIHTLVGHKFEGENFPRNPNHIQQFIFANINGVAPISGMDGKLPAGVMRVRTPGIHTIGYFSNRSFTELDAAKFEQYLRESGFEHVIDIRAKKNESQKKGLEYFSRCVKTMVAVNKDFNGPYDHIFGFPLELVPEDNPFIFEGQKEFSVRLLYQGKPLVGVLVQATPKNNKDQTWEKRTNEEGRVMIPISCGGAWLINTVHIVALPAGMEADWESFWASLYLEFPEPKPAPDQENVEKPKTPKEEEKK